MVNKTMNNRLHIGCGPIYLDGWTNIDWGSHFRTDLCINCLDLDKHFAAESVERILSVHHLEHLTYPTGVQSFLAQCYKVLQPGGVMRLALPDLRLIATAYVNGSDLKEIYGEHFKGYYHHDCAAERFQYWAREWEHTFLPDFELMEKLLREAGFAAGKIRKVPPNQSVWPDWKHDRYISESLYLEITR